MQNAVDWYGPGKKIFQACDRIFVCVNIVTSVTCIDNILMNLVFR